MSQRKPEIPEIPYEEARASVVLWKKGRKKKPTHLLYSVWNLVHRYHNGSYKDAANDVKDISVWQMMKLAYAGEVVASSELVNRLREEGKISTDVVAESRGIKDPALREKVLETVSGMKLALDQRQVVRYAKQYPHASLEQFKERVLTSKGKKERVFLAILPLVEKEYEEMKEEAKKLRMSWDELCMKIIKDWLNERRST